MTNDNTLVPTPPGLLAAVLGGAGSPELAARLAAYPGTPLEAVGPLWARAVEGGGKSAFYADHLKDAAHRVLREVGPAAAAGIIGAEVRTGVLERLCADLDADGETGEVATALAGWAVSRRSAKMRPSRNSDRGGPGGPAVGIL